MNYSKLRFPLVLPLALVPRVFFIGFVMPDNCSYGCLFAGLQLLKCGKLAGLLNFGFETYYALENLGLSCAIAVLGMEDIIIVD
jgi:hypothetical protein